MQEPILKTEEILEIVKTDSLSGFYGGSASFVSTKYKRNVPVAGESKKQARERQHREYILEQEREQENRRFQGRVLPVIYEE